MRHAGGYEIRAQNTAVQTLGSTMSIAPSSLASFGKKMNHGRI
jgi:hypothetical protein